MPRLGTGAARANVTAESLIERAEKVYQGSCEAKQYNAANGAIREMGVLTGHRIERAEIGEPGQFDALEDDELERLLVERLGALGFSLSIAEGGDTQH